MPDESGPNVVSYNHLNFVPRFECGDQAQVAVVTGSEHGTELGTGLVRFIDADIPWTVQYDEVVLVIEGLLTIITDDVRLRARPKDSIWIPRGTKLRYVSKDALVFYAIHPSNWHEAVS